MKISNYAINLAGATLSTIDSSQSIPMRLSVTLKAFVKSLS